MSLSVDKVQTSIVIDNNQAINKLGELEMAYSEVRKELNGVIKDNEKYEKSLEKAKQYEVGAKKYQEANDKISVLNKYVERYSTLLQKAEVSAKGLKKGTAEYENSQQKIEKINSKLTQFRKNITSIEYEAKRNRFAADKFKELNDEANKLKASADKMKEVGKRFEDAKKNVDDYRSGVKATELPMEQLRKEAKLMQSQLDKLPKNSKNFTPLSNRLKEVNTAIKQQKSELNSTETGWKKFTGSFKSFGIMAAGVIGGEIVIQAFQWITSFVVGIATGAAKISDELSDIQKSTGMTAEEVKSLNSELGKIDTRSSSASLREIAKVAGQLGIKKDEIKGFTEQVDQMNVALGDEFTGGAEEITRKVGTLQTLFKDTKDMKADEAMNRIGSSLNALGAAGKARAPEVADFANRLGALGKLAPSITESLGLAAALTGELGLTSEQAAGGVTNIMLEAGKNVEAFSAQIGITQDEFKNLLNTDPNEMFLRLAQSMQGLDNDQIITALGNMKIGSQEAIKVMQQLAENTDLVTEKQALAAKEFELATSLQNEFNLKNENFAATLEKAGKAWNGFIAGIGSKLQPIMQVALQLFTKLFSKTEKAPESLQPLIKVFSKLWDSLKTIGNAIFEVINAFGIFDGESDLWKTTIKILAAAVEVLAFQFNFVATQIKKAKEDFIGFYNESETFRRIVTGSIEAVKQIFSGFFKTVGTGFEAISDLLTAIVTGDLKMFESALNKTWEVLKDLAYENAYDTAEAFAKGYIKGADKIEIKPKVDTKEAEQQLQDFTEKQKSLISKVQGLKKISNSDKNPIISELEFYAQSTEEQRKAIEAKVNELIKTNNQRLFSSNNKAAGKKANTEADKLIEDFKKFQDKIREYQEQESMNALSGENKEVLEAQMKYAALIEEAKKFKADKEQIESEINKIDELKANELTAIRKKYAAEEEKAREEKRKLFEEGKKEAELTIKTELATENQRELMEMEAHYTNLIALATQFGLDTVALENAKKDALNALQNKQKEAQTNKTIEENEKQRAANFQFANSLMDIFTATNNLMGEQSAGYLEFQKMITIAQIAIDTASAISSITSKSAATSLTPIDFAIKVASGIAVVIANIAKAKQVLSTSNTPEPPKFAKGGKINIQGNSHANGGIAMVNKGGQKVGEMEGGESYLLLSKNTTKNNSPLINALLQSSQTNGAAVVPNFAAMQNAIRTSNTTINNTTNTSSNSDALLVELLIETRMQREAMEKMPTNLKANIVYSDFEKADKKVKEIRNYSGQ